MIRPKNTIGRLTVAVCTVVALESCELWTFRNIFWCDYT
jgi:hypothetical protein